MTLSSTTQSSSANDATTKRVSFAPLTAVVETIHLDDITTEERAAYWMTNADKLLAKQQVQEALLPENGQPPQVEPELRGIEVYAPKRARRRRAARQKASLAVFVVQERQQRYGYIDEDEISLAYSVHANRCQQEALDVGIADSHAVADDNDTEECNESIRTSTQRKRKEPHRASSSKTLTKTSPIGLRRLLPSRLFVSTTAVSA